MKSLMMLWRVAALEWGSICSACTSRDVETVARRVECEGFSFFTITLPQFCKDLEKGLAEGRVGPDQFAGFQRRGRLPKFLGGLMDLIFDRGTGCLLSDPSVDAIQAVRWLTSVFGKLELPTTPAREAAAINGFVECEYEVRCSDARTEESLLGDFDRVVGVLWSEVLTGVDHDIYQDIDGRRGRDNSPWSPALIPKHGPGATADRLSGNQKFNLSYWPERLERVFPFLEFAIPNYRYFECLERVNFVEPKDELPVKLTAVPKTMKTPRLIAIEPTAMQYMQQALKNNLVSAIQKDSSMGRIVGFDDQPVNNRLACEGSLTQGLATLDLSEASDRVSNQLVRRLVARWPHVAEAFDATRSRKVDVPGHGVLRLAKFASMGSALTFPVEAMVFATVVFLGIESELKRPLRRRDIQSLRHRVRVYGDDIIVPTEYALSVVKYLELFGFKVNMNKSFWKGSFRESCGKEYYAGNDVSIDRLRKVVQEGDQLVLPTQRSYVSELESLVSFRNKVYLRGLWRTAQWLDDWISPILWGYYPVVEVTDGGPEEGLYSRAHLLGRWSFLGYQSERTHRTLHKPLVKGWVVKHRIPKTSVSDVGALQKVLLKQGSEPFADVKHLERSGRPEAVCMKLRWTSPA